MFFGEVKIVGTANPTFIREGQGVRKPALTVLLVLVLATLFVSGCSSERVKSDDEIVKIFKELDQLDFNAQNIVADKERSEQLVREIYTEPQLSEALKYLEEMRRNKVKLVHYNTDYKEIKVLEKSADSAKLLVHAHTTGAYYTTDVPETKLGPLDHESKYEITLKKIEDKWKIASVKYLNLEPQEQTETTKEGESKS